MNIVTILKITGIVGGHFGTSSPFDGNVQASFRLFEDGFSMVKLLNIGLFIPFGFFSLVVFRKLKNRWIYGVLIGLLFSIMIEFLQSFVGRFVQLEDILMNTVGTFLGYGICFWLLELKQKRKKV
ncbi:MAG: VanZ family protein [Lachnotalea sp.]